MFKVGDTVRVKATGQTAKIIGQGSMPLPRPDTTVWNIALAGGGSVNVLPEEIEPLDKQ
jgi:hypothetical protein